MNLCKVLQAQAGSMKGTWSSARVGGKNVKLPGTKKCSADDEELKTPVALAVAKTTKTTKKKSKKDKYESEADNIAEKFNFKQLVIDSDYD